MKSGSQCALSRERGIKNVNERRKNRLERERMNEWMERLNFGIAPGGTEREIEAAAATVLLVCFFFLQKSCCIDPP